MNKPSSLLLLASLLLPAAAPAVVIIPDTASRTLRAEAAHLDASDSQFLSLPGLDAVCETAGVMLKEGTPAETFAFGALDTTDLGSPTLTSFSVARISALVRTGTGDPDAFANALANFSFRFTVDEPAHFTLGGFMSLSVDGHATAGPVADTFVLLLKDGSTLFEASTFGSYGTTGTLLPTSTYTLVLRAAADVTGASRSQDSSFGLDFEITPVPEPAALAGVAAAGLLGFAAWRRRAR